MPEPLRILDHLRIRSSEIPQKTFVTDHLRSVTYGEFYQQILSTAAALQNRGVEQEDRVLLVLEHGIDHLRCYFACIYIGAIPVNLSISKPVEGIVLAAQITGAKHGIFQGYPHEISNPSFSMYAYEELEEKSAIPVPGYCDIAYMMFTSGTTGIPKAVMTSHDNTMATALSILDFAGMTANDRELISLPLAFTFGLGHIHALIMVGGEAYLTNRRYDLAYLTQAISDEKATGFLASPAMLREMIRDHREVFAACNGQLRYLVVNCTPMEPELTERLLELLPDVQIYMYYGMTEASRCAYIHYNSNRHRLDFTGKACKNVELKIDLPDEHGMGEICMRGPNVMPGYWNNPEATDKVLEKDGWIHSGDLGIMDEDGYIKVIGRMNDQISVDGMKCQPAEVEKIIAQLDFVERVTVCGIADCERFQIVGAAIIPKGNLPEDYREQIKAHCHSKLEPFKVPVVAEAIDTFPANELGKVNRKELAELLIRQTEKIC